MESLGALTRPDTLASLELLDGFFGSDFLPFPPQGGEEVGVVRVLAGRIERPDDRVVVTPKIHIGVVLVAGQDSEAVRSDSGFFRDDGRLLGFGVILDDDFLFHRFLLFGLQ